MTGGLTDLDLEPSARTEAFDSPIFLQPREAKRCRFVECFRLHIDRVRYTRRALEANGTEPEGHGRTAYHFRCLFACQRYPLFDPYLIPNESRFGSDTLHEFSLMSWAQSTRHG